MGRADGCTVEEKQKEGNKFRLRPDRRKEKSGLWCAFGLLDFENKIFVGMVVPRRVPRGGGRPQTTDVMA